jgi:hypothetical protein
MPDAVKLAKALRLAADALTPPRNDEEAKALDALLQVFPRGYDAEKTPRWHFVKRYFDVRRCGWNRWEAFRWAVWPRDWYSDNA